ncbi:MAG: transglycosylase SLT domain-containing protein [Pseudomonadota bacterium]
MAVNLELGQTYVTYLMDNHVEGDLLQMAIAYNGGPGNLRRWKARVGAEDDPLLFMESIPNPESRGYVEKVLTNLWIYRARLGQPTPSLEQLARGEWPKYVALDEGA